MYEYWRCILQYVSRSIFSSNGSSSSSTSAVPTTHKRTQPLPPSILPPAARTARHTRTAPSRSHTPRTPIPLCASTTPRPPFLGCPHSPHRPHPSNAVIAQTPPPPQQDTALHLPKPPRHEIRNGHEKSAISIHD